MADVIHGEFIQNSEEMLDGFPARVISLVSSIHTEYVSSCFIKSLPGTIGQQLPPDILGNDHLDIKPLLKFN